MFEVNQKTLQKSVTFEGVGLHSGLSSKVKVLPASENHGIIFKRVDLEDKNIIQASYKNVSSAKLCTTLQNEFGHKISTVEHLLAAFYITGIDNALVEVNNSEIPIMDGSSKEFVKLINDTGLVTQKEKRKYLKIIKKVEMSDNEKTISIEPNTEGLKVDFKLEYNNPIIGNQRNSVNFISQDLEEIYNSRTFCLYEDIEKIKKLGLAKGGSLENAIVVKNEEILNSEGLRNNKEFVNHKILDLAGDFLLSGYRMLGTVKCVQGGHSLSNLFLKDIFKDSSNFMVVKFDDRVNAKTIFKTSVNKLAVNA
jgi:UDP-3-O-[3-hydroxymyristoyl] N-acetylglucosamine deacetylase